MRKITAYAIAKKIGKDPAFLYRIVRGEVGCPATLAGAIEEAARSIAAEKGMPSQSLEGWRLIDLRPDIYRMAHASAAAIVQDAAQSS